MRANKMLDYPYDVVPLEGEALPVAPGVLWIRMPLNLSLTHINVWAIEDGEGWTIVDTGLASERTLAAWQKLLDGPLEGRPVNRVIVTHMHADHIGMAGWLVRRFSARLWMTRLEYLSCRVMVADTGRSAPEDSIRFFRRAGWNDEAIELYRVRFGNFGKYIHSLPDSYCRLSDGQSIQIGATSWKVIVGNGHSPEHACLYCEQLKVLISGDQVLPKISSNISVYPTEPDANPLAGWLASIEKLRAALPEDVLVLPAHNEPFHGLHVRLGRLHDSHYTALARLRKALAEPKRAVDVFGSLFARKITDDPMLLGMATGESIAHLNYLLLSGDAHCHVDGSGVAWYRSACESDALDGGATAYV
jgi:glyoxylase-like metal-dependent hydrolase (beta-lactamase superfamily II)